MSFSAYPHSKVFYLALPFPAFATTVDENAIGCCVPRLIRNHLCLPTCPPARRSTCIRTIFMTPPLPFSSFATTVDGWEPRRLSFVCPLRRGRWRAWSWLLRRLFSSSTGPSRRRTPCFQRQVNQPSQLAVILLSLLLLLFRVAVSGAHLSREYGSYFVVVGLSVGVSSIRGSCDLSMPYVARVLCCTCALAAVRRSGRNGCG